MMKKMLAYLGTGLFLVGVAGVAGVAQAAGCLNGGDFFIEGPTYNRDCKQSPIIPTKVVDEGHLYIEGMGFAPRPKGPKTVVQKISYERDWCCEGVTDEESEMHIKKMNIIVPAAGN